MANVSPKVVLGIFFLTLSGIDIDFLSQELWWRTYTTKEVLLTTRCIKLMGKKEFTPTALDPEHKTYVIYVGSVSFVVSPSFPPLELDVHTSRIPQISALINRKALTKVPNKYVDFAIVFSLELAFKLSEHTKINDYAIKLVNGQQLPYWPIYSLEPVELEILKAFIETNLANEFMKLFKALAGAFILFD